MLSANLAALALAVATVATTGCGSSAKPANTNSSTGSSATTAVTSTTRTSSPQTVKLAAGKPLSRREWIAKGDAICSRLNAWLAANPVKSVREFAQILPQAAAYEREEYNRLIQLVPPASKTKDWLTFLAQTRQWAENSAAIAASAQSGQFTLNTPLATSTRKIHESLAHLAGHDGFKACSLV